MAHEQEMQRRTARELWQSRAGAWDKWADRLRPLAERMNRPLLEAAALAPGLRVLDLASGIGQPAFDIAGAVGADGHVTATDVVADMLAATERRAAEDGITNMSFHTADMEDLPFDAGRFDRVTCRFGLMFTPDPVRALSEAARVLRPGGRAAFMVWGPEEDVTMFQVINRVVREVLGESPHDRHEFTPFRLGQPGALRQIFAAAGLDAVAELEHRFAPAIDAGTPFWRPNLEMSLGDRFAALGEAEVRDLDARLAAAFEDYRQGDKIHLQSHIRIGVGTAPGL